MEKIDNRFKNIITSILIIASSGCLCGCNDYLDIKSQSSLVTPNTVESLQQLMDGAFYMNFNTLGYGEASADDYFLTTSSFNAMGEQSRQIYTWSYFNQIFETDWARGYVPVYQANLAIDQLKKIDRNEKNMEKWDNVFGSALFYRAYQYLSLVWVYGQAYARETANSEFGIVLRENSDPNVPSTRATLEETYLQIIADFQRAIAYLPLRPTHPMRPSKLAAYGALARTYLSMARFADAYRYADSVLMYHDYLLDFNNPDEVDLGGELPFGQFNKEILFYSEFARIHSTISRHNCFIDTALYKTYSDGDLRKQAFFLLNPNGYPSFKGNYAANADDHFSGIATDELLLIRAECAVRNGENNKALADLNTLLKSRWENGSFTNVKDTNDMDLLSVILQERRKELLLRGLRWIDIKRLNREGDDVELKRILNGEAIFLPANDKRFALPLPEDIIRITGIPQNEY